MRDVGLDVTIKEPAEIFTASENFVRTYFGSKYLADTVFFSAYSNTVINFLRT